MQEEPEGLSSGFHPSALGDFFGLWAELLEPRIPCASPKGTGEPKDLGSGGP